MRNDRPTNAPRLVGTTAPADFHQCQPVPALHRQRARASCVSAGRSIFFGWRTAAGSSRRRATGATSSCRSRRRRRCSATGRRVTVVGQPAEESETGCQVGMPLARATSGVPGVDSATVRPPGCTTPARPGTPPDSRRARTPSSGRRSAPSPGTSSAMSAIWVRANSTSRRIGPLEHERRSGCRPRAAAAPSRMRRHDSAGETLRAANRPTACFTTTASTPSPSSAFASAASA